MEIDSPTLDGEAKALEMPHEDTRQSMSSEPLINLEPNTQQNSSVEPLINLECNSQQNPPTEPLINLGSELETLNLQEDIGLRTLVVNHGTCEQDQSHVVDLEGHSQPDVAETRPLKYSGSIDVAVQIFRHEGGFIGFFKGLSPTFLREVFGNAAYFGSYQGIVKLYDIKCNHVNEPYHPTIEM